MDGCDSKALDALSAHRSDLLACQVVRVTARFVLGNDLFIQWRTPEGETRLTRL